MAMAFRLPMLSAYLNSFFTTAAAPSRAESSDEWAVGSGLGLTIVRDIVNGYSGSIALVVPPSGFTTAFRIELPAATEDQIGQLPY